MNNKLVNIIASSIVLVSAGFAGFNADAANLNLGNGKITTGGVVIQGVSANTPVTMDLASENSIQVMGTVSELTSDSLMVGGHEYITEDGINAGHQRITGVRAGKANTDAVNVRQLKAVDSQVTANSERISANSERISANSEKIADLKSTVSNLDQRVDNVGANLAALAALHPTDGDSRLSIAAGIGNYAGSNAAALGVFYRPRNNVMLSVAGSFGASENMVNAGVSVRIGSGSSKSKAELVRENKELASRVDSLEDEVEELHRMVSMLIMINNER